MSYVLDAEGKNCPREYLQSDSPTQRVQEINLVLDIFRAEDNYSRFIVLGDSEGVFVANLLAARADYIVATISFNGGGRWFTNTVIHGVTPQFRNSDEALESVGGFGAFA